MANPIFVRDKINTGKWYAYVYAGNNFWTRYDFYVPLGASSLADYFCLQQICYGKVYEGQTIRPEGDNNPTQWQEVLTSDWTSLGSWGGELQTFYDGRKNAQFTRGATISIPTDHNVVKVLVHKDVTNDTAVFAWSDAVVPRRQASVSK